VRTDGRGIVPVPVRPRSIARLIGEVIDRV